MSQLSIKNEKVGSPSPFVRADKVRPLEIVLFDGGTLFRLSSAEQVSLRASGLNWSEMYGADKPLGNRIVFLEFESGDLVCLEPNDEVETVVSARLYLKTL
jgi:hypothetical protein